MKHFDFKDGVDLGEFFYCYSPQAKCCGVFEREEDCIKNSYNAQVGDYEYTTIMLREKLEAGAVISTECSFEKRGPIPGEYADYASVGIGLPGTKQH